MDKCKTAARLGEIRNNNFGTPMKIIEYNSSQDITVEFQDEYKYKRKTIYINFVNGNILNPYDPTILGIGRLGGIKLQTKYPHCYSIWEMILRRTNGDQDRKDFRKYLDCTMQESWKIFSNFLEWYLNQPNLKALMKHHKRYAIDKDILFRGNKIYDEKHCTLVPQRVNNLFLNRKVCRGDTPLGVQRKGDSFLANCSKNGKKHSLGSYKTIEEAFEVYKTFKENYIKEVANEEYEKGTITQDCYNALTNYEIRIGD